MATAATKRGRGRPPLGRDEKLAGQIKAMVAMGLTDLEISTVIPMAPQTVRKYYMAELQAGPPEANMRVAQSLFRMATDATKPNVIAAIFWLKCRAHWRERDEDIGKKEVADLLARVSEKGSDWEKLLK
jgi:hypothetical protein